MSSFVESERRLLAVMDKVKDAFVERCIKVKEKNGGVTVPLRN
jgi:hypothetical protein